MYVAASVGLEPATFTLLWSVTCGVKIASDNSTFCIATGWVTCSSGATVFQIVTVVAEEWPDTDSFWFRVGGRHVLELQFSHRQTMTVSAGFVYTGLWLTGRFWSAGVLDMVLSEMHVVGHWANSLKMAKKANAGTLKTKLLTHSAARSAVSTFKLSIIV